MMFRQWIFIHKQAKLKIIEEIIIQCMCDFASNDNNV